MELYDKIGCNKNDNYTSLKQLPLREYFYYINTHDFLFAFMPLVVYADLITLTLWDL